MFYLDTAAFISSLFLLNEKVLCMIMRIMNNQNSSKPLGTVLPPAGIHMLFRQTERERDRKRENGNISDDIIAVPCSRGTSLRNPPLYST